MKDANWYQSSHDQLDRQAKLKKKKATPIVFGTISLPVTVHYNFHSNAVYGVSNRLWKKCLWMNETSIIYQIACFVNQSTYTKKNVGISGFDTDWFS